MNKNLTCFSQNECLRELCHNEEVYVSLQKAICFQFGKYVSNKKECHWTSVLLLSSIINREGGTQIDNHNTSSHQQRLCWWTVSADMYLTKYALIKVNYNNQISRNRTLSVNSLILRPEISRRLSPVQRSPEHMDMNKHTWKDERKNVYSDERKCNSQNHTQLKKKMQVNIEILQYFT